jgi:three-Cys-motif partner protein
MELFRRKDMNMDHLNGEADSLSMRLSGSWARKKLDYLERYIDAFVVSMHDKPWRSMHYIDLFAGPGKCRDRRSGEIYLGSPLIALKATYPFTRYFFVDLDPDNIAVLHERCLASPLSDRIHYFAGDSNDVVDQIAERISAIDRKFIAGRWSSLNLAFLDPQGMDLYWETVKTLAELRRMDLIIHYPQMGLTRYMPQACNTAEENKVDLFFGGREWREVYQEWRERTGLHRQLIDHYKEKLRGLGYEEVIRGDEPEPLMRNVARRAPLYRLIFASKHPLGHDFWREVTKRDVYGQHRLL